MFDGLIDIPRLLQRTVKAGKSGTREACRMIVRELLAAYDDLVSWKVQLLLELHDQADRQLFDSDEEYLMPFNLEVSYSVFLHWAGLVEISLAVNALLT